MLARMGNLVSKSDREARRGFAKSAMEIRRGIWKNATWLNSLVNYSGWKSTIEFRNNRRRFPAVRVVGNLHVCLNLAETAGLLVNM